MQYVKYLITRKLLQRITNNAKFYILFTDNNYQNGFIEYIIYFYDSDTLLNCHGSLTK